MDRSALPALLAAALGPAVAVGVAAVFMETHRDPDQAPSDGPNMVPPFPAVSALATTLAISHAARKLIGRSLIRHFRLYLGPV